MRQSAWKFVLVLIFVFAGFFVFTVGSTIVAFFRGGADEPIKIVKKDSILRLELNGVILDGKKFLKQLKKYREEDNIKAVVIEVNSPGGVVGPSQEIHAEILKIRQTLKKPVVVVSTGLMASGAYYAAVAADKIMVAPGTMMGSIGVIMEFINLEKLYDWAKVSRYSINTGKFKDSGAEYRAMRADERALFQDLVNDVYGQFKQAVVDGRSLKPDFVSEYADGRVFTGAQGVKLGFADALGTIDDAYEMASDLAGLDEYEIFEPPKRRPGILEMISAQAGGADDDAESLFNSGRGIDSTVNSAIKKLLHTELANRPLFLMPGSW
jgi:protease IV